MAMLHFPTNGAICDARARMSNAGARVGKHCVFPGHSHGHVTFAHRVTRDICNVRACTYVKCKLQGLG